eukprot:364254-Chlamydomonas_euryale.AAC.17
MGAGIKNSGAAARLRRPIRPACSGPAMCVALLTGLSTGALPKRLRPRCSRGRRTAGNGTGSIRRAPWLCVATGERAGRAAHARVNRLLCVAHGFVRLPCGQGPRHACRPHLCPSVGRPPTVRVDMHEEHLTRRRDEHAASRLRRGLGDRERPGFGPGCGGERRHRRGFAEAAIASARSGAQQHGQGPIGRSETPPWVTITVAAAAAATAAAIAAVVEEAAATTTIRAAAAATTTAAAETTAAEARVGAPAAITIGTTKAGAAAATPAAAAASTTTTTTGEAAAAAAAAAEDVIRATGDVSLLSRRGRGRGGHAGVPGGFPGVACCMQTRAGARPCKRKHSTKGAAAMRPSLAPAHDRSYPSRLARAVVEGAGMGCTTQRGAEEEERGALRGASSSHARNPS